MMLIRCLGLELMHAGFNRAPPFFADMGFNHASCVCPDFFVYRVIMFAFLLWQMSIPRIVSGNHQERLILQFYLWSGRLAKPCWSHWNPDPGRKHISAWNSFAGGLLSSSASSSSLECKTLGQGIVLNPWDVSNMHMEIQSILTFEQLHYKRCIES